MQTNNETNVSVLNQDKLKAVVNASHTAIVTTLLLALRRRARDYSNLPATKDQLINMGEKIVDEDYKQYWQNLQDLGVGSVIYGRRGNPDRFQWHYSLKTVAKAAIEGKEAQVEALAKKKPKTAIKHLGHNRIKTNAKAIRTSKKLYIIPLERGMTAEIILSRDLTVKDIAKVKRILSG